MNLKDLVRELPLTRLIGPADREIASLCWDSRRAAPGSLFVAVRGFQTDGHAYIPAALERGACALVAEEVPEALPEGVTCVVVENSRAALAQLAACWYGHPERQLKLIGVTGTNGKTTVTHLVRHILEKNGVACGLIGTNGIRFGQVVRESARTTPESAELYALLREMADAGMACVAMEVSSHSLALDRVLGLHFAAAAFTNLTQDHLDYHKTMEEYRAAKGRLFAQSEQAVLNLDDEAGQYFAQHVECPVTTYSENKDCADLTAKNIRLFSTHVEFEAVARSQIARAFLPIPGGFTIYNALAALGCGLSLGIPLADSVPPLRSVQGVKGRVEVVPVPTAYTVIIDYAHSPDALENVLSTARDFTPGRLICLFGCGGDRDRSKRALMGAAAGELADLVVVTTDNPRTEPPQDIIRDILPGLEGMPAQVHVEPDRIAAIRYCLDQGRPGDVIVLAGKGHETYQEIMGARIPLDEREVVRAYFREQDTKISEKQHPAGGKIPTGMIK